MGPMGVTGWVLLFLVLASLNGGGAHAVNVQKYSTTDPKSRSTIAGKFSRLFACTGGLLRGGASTADSQTELKKPLLSPDKASTCPRIVPDHAAGAEEAAPKNFTPGAAASASPTTTETTLVGGPERQTTPSSSSSWASQPLGEQGSGTGKQLHQKLNVPHGTPVISGEDIALEQVRDVAQPRPRNDGGSSAEPLAALWTTTCTRQKEEPAAVAVTSVRRRSFLAATTRSGGEERPQLEPLPTRRSSPSAFWSAVPQVATGTGNRQPGTRNKEPGTGNRHTSRAELAAFVGRPGTGNREPATGTPRGQSSPRSSAANSSASRSNSSSSFDSVRAYAGGGFMLPPPVPFDPLFHPLEAEDAFLFHPFGAADPFSVSALGYELAFHSRQPSFLAYREDARFSRSSLLQRGRRDHFRLRSVDGNGNYNGDGREDASLSLFGVSDFFFDGDRDRDSYTGSRLRRGGDEDVDDAEDLPPLRVRINTGQAATTEHAAEVARAQTNRGGDEPARRPDRSRTHGKFNLRAPRAASSRTTLAEQHLAADLPRGLSDSVAPVPTGGPAALSGGRVPQMLLSEGGDATHMRDQ